MRDQTMMTTKSHSEVVGRAGVVPGDFLDMYFSPKSVFLRQVFARPGGQVAFIGNIASETRKTRRFMSIVLLAEKGAMPARSGC